MNSFKKNTILLSIGTFLNKGIQFIVIPLFSAWLSTAEYGQFDILYTYVLLLIPVITLEIHEAVFRFGADEESQFNKKGIISAGFFVVAVNTVIAVLACLIIYFYTKPDYLFFFCIYLVSEAISTYLKGYLRAIKRLDIYSFSMVFSTLFMSVFVTIFIFVLNMGLKGMLLGYALGSIIGNVVMIVWGKWLSMLSVKAVLKCNVKKMIEYSLPLMPNDISWWIMSASDRQIVNLFFNNDANGILAIAHKIPALCSVIFNVFSISWQQNAIERINTKEFKSYFNEIFNKMMVLILTICSGVLAVSYFIYYFIFDAKYLEAKLYSPILIAAAVFMSMSLLFGGVQIALKRPKQNGFTTCIGAVVNILVHLILINYIGLYAAAVSTFVSNFVILIVRAFLLRNELSVRFNKKTWAIIVVFIYFFFSAYVYKLYFCIINLFLAGVLFLVMNKKIIVGLLKK